jgi:hypothetical protein
LNADDDERQKPENWIVICWLPIYDDSKAKRLRPKRGYESIPARKIRLFHDYWQAILRKWEKKTKDSRDIIWADSLRRKTSLFWFVGFSLVPFWEISRYFQNLETF